MSSGHCLTFSRCGTYWMSSSTSERKTTAPGVVARVWPTSNASGSTMLGTRGAVTLSRTRFRSPDSTLPPPVSIAAFHATGLISGLLLGAMASKTFSRTKLTRSLSRQPSSASATRASAVVSAAR